MAKSSLVWSLFLCILCLLFLIIWSNSSSNQETYSSSTLLSGFKKKDDFFAKNRKCDACRIIAYAFDSVFEIFESNHPDEDLSDEAVQNIVSRVCTKKTFERIIPVEVSEKQRLLVSEVPIADSGIWPQRLKNHCLYFARELLNGPEIYDMWLRVSAGRPGNFENFLCQGEGAFSDCEDGKTTLSWPAGDEVTEEIDEENEEEEEAEEDFTWEGIFNSASSIF